MRLSLYTMERMSQDIRWHLDECNFNRKKSYTERCFFFHSSFINLHWLNLHSLLTMQVFFFHFVPLDMVHFVCFISCMCALPSTSYIFWLVYLFANYTHTHNICYVVGFANIIAQLLVFHKENDSIKRNKHWQKKLMMNVWLDGRKSESTLEWV